MSGSAPTDRTRAPRRYYRAFGLTIASDIILAGAIRTDATDAADVTIRRGTVPRRFHDSEELAPNVRYRARDMLFDIAGVARFRIRSGVEIVYAPEASASAEAIGLYVIGTALGVLCQQRGLIPLHASTVEIDGKAVCFCGASGAGKSTMAAFLAKRGHRVLSDDVAALGIKDGRVVTWVGIPRLRLWRDAGERTGWDLSRARQVTVGVDKYEVTVPTDDATETNAIVDRVYVLERGLALGRSAPLRLSGAAAVARLLSNIYRGWALGPSEAGSAAIQTAAALAEQSGVYLVSNDWSDQDYGTAAMRLEQHILSDQSAVAAAA